MATTYAYSKPRSASSEPRAPTRKVLTAHQARHLKRRLVTAFCEERLSAAAVQRAFDIFPELRDA